MAKTEECCGRVIGNDSTIRRLLADEWNNGVVDEMVVVRRGAIVLVSMVGTLRHGGSGSEPWVPAH